jgi:gliding motility-associated lipoprotein GldD
MNVKTFILPCVLIISLLSSCDNDDELYSPRPRGYCRIDFPEKKYELFDKSCAYNFEIPVYAHAVKYTKKDAQPCWYNLEFPQFKATIHLSYKEVNNNIANFIDTSHYFAKKHQARATGIEETVVIRDSAKVYGLLFEIDGNAASSLQFYLTDSVKHFVRGSLYFNARPNIDSSKIVVDFIKKDILHLINTTQWKKE